MLLLALPAGWLWFGADGALPLLVWWWHHRPVAAAGGVWEIDFDAVRSARLEPWRTRIELRDGRRLEIFADEIAPGDLALVRRTLRGPALV